MITIRPPYCLGPFRKPAFWKKGNFSIIFRHKTSPIMSPEISLPFEEIVDGFLPSKQMQNGSLRQETALPSTLSPITEPLAVVVANHHGRDHRHHRFYQKTSFKACTGLVKIEPMNHMKTSRKISRIPNPACLHRQDQPTSSLRANKEGKPSLVPLNPIATARINSRSNPGTEWALGKSYP